LTETSPGFRPKDLTVRHGHAAMPLRAARYITFALPLTLLTGCGDEPPVYPPIVIIGDLGSGGTGTSPGNQAGGSQGPSPSAGSSNTSGGSSSNGGSGGSANGGLFAHCSQFYSAPEPPVKTACDLGKLEDGGELKGDVTSDRTLKGGRSYTLSGVVRVMQGKTLTIEPCTKIMGKDSDAVLVVMSSALGDPTAGCTFQGGTMTPGGKLVAVGEPMAPIIFTSSKPVGQRAPGDWGGLLLLGNARNDLAKKTARVGVEGLARSECHGYHTDEFNDESSGRLEYVRIEYASRQVSTDSETNGLTFGSLGRGTIVRYVMVSNSNDDCFEWFGGTMNADHLIALNCDDDMFDIDNGYSGHLQFLFGREYTSSTENDSRGFEITQGDGTSSVLTSVKISNATMCGAGPGAKGSTERGGASFKDSSQVELQNTFLTGFTSAGNRYGLDVKGAAPKLSGVHIFNQQPIFFSSTAAASKEAFDAGNANSVADPDRFCDCWANPPAPVAATPTDGVSADAFPADGEASYVGAFRDANADSNWMRGLWVDWSDK
jgi:hypothetical protein